MASGDNISTRLQLRGSRSYCLAKGFSLSAETLGTWTKFFLTVSQETVSCCSLCWVALPPTPRPFLHQVASLESFPNYLCLTCRAHHCSVPSHHCHCPAEPGCPLPSTDTENLPKAETKPFISVSIAPGTVQLCRMNTWLQTFVCRHCEYMKTM